MHDFASRAVDPVFCPVFQFPHILLWSKNTDHLLVNRHHFGVFRVGSALFGLENLLPEFIESEDISTLSKGFPWLRGGFEG